MAKLRIVGQSKVGTIKEKFREAMGVDLQIYDQSGEPAPDNVTFGSIRSKSPTSVEVTIAGQTLVKNVEAFFEDNYGVKIDILNEDGSLADNEFTLGSIRRRYSDEETEIMTEIEKLVFTAEYCGELGAGKLEGKALDLFKEKYSKKELGDSEFIDTPFEYVDYYATGICAMEQDLESWGLPEAELRSEGIVGIPRDENDVLKPGTYLLYAVLCDSYEVELKVADKEGVSFIGREIDFASIEPDFEAGQMDGMILVCETEIDGNEEDMLEFMTENGELRQSVVIVEVNGDGEASEIYINQSGKESYLVDSEFYLRDCEKSKSLNEKGNHKKGVVG